jgi:nucleotide-binding universal stress UspA family protein
MAREILPYRAAPETSVDFHGWMLASVDGARSLPTYLEGWDPQTDVQIERRIQCDVGALRAATGLLEPVPLNVTVSWVNQQSYMTETLYREPLVTDQVIRTTLPANRLGGSIKLLTSITVATTDTTRPLGTARWGGSVLSRDEQTVVLEGNGPMFPIAAVDFASTRYSPAASFALQLPDELGLPVLGSVLLLVNQRDTELSNALSSAEPDPRESALLDELETAIGARLIAEAVSRREELQREVWPEESTGSLLAGYLRIADEERVGDAVIAGDPDLASSAYIGAARLNGFGRRIS